MATQPSSRSPETRLYGDNVVLKFTDFWPAAIGRLVEAPPLTVTSAALAKLFLRVG